MEDVLSNQIMASLFQTKHLIIENLIAAIICTKT
jgi:hypothetical protein